MYFNFRNYIVFFKIMLLVFVIHPINLVRAECGCKELRGCYMTMLEELIDRDEAACITDAIAGVSTYLVFLTALKQYCGTFINVTVGGETDEGRFLYEVQLNTSYTGGEDKRPVIIIDAGQSAGTESMMFALYIIEQLVACTENTDMIDKARWIILPSTNPDGMEFGRHGRPNWTKNMRRDKTLVTGVDISRNFGSNWDVCDKKHGMAMTYAGEKAFSEKESVFIKNTLEKYSINTQAYVSIRRDGHALLYPYSYSMNLPVKVETIQKAAYYMSTKVNQKAGSVQTFINDTIYNATGKQYCGHSVDYAFDVGIPLTFEMRVFMGKDSHIMSKFQSLPRGFENNLRQGYFAGIKELFKIVTEEEKYGLALRHRAH